MYLYIFNNKSKVIEEIKLYVEIINCNEQNREIEFQKFLWA